MLLKIHYIELSSCNPADISPKLATLHKPTTPLSAANLYETTSNQTM